MNVIPGFKNIKHFHEPGHFHEFTFSCYKRLPLLTNNQWREKLSRSIECACEDCEVELAAFVFMPEHVHLLALPLSVSPNLDWFLSRIKQPVSSFVKKSLIASGSNLLQRLTIRDRPGKKTFRFWQEGPGYDRNIFTLDAINASVDYIHQNPVRRGLCHRATEWKWSSARYYLLEPPKQQFAELPPIHGITPDALQPGYGC